MRARRTVAVAALLVVGVVTLAPHVRLYVEQQQREAALRTEIAEREAVVEQLQDERALWDDDAFVAAQARERLNYAYPGETRYIVPTSPPAAPAADPAATPTGTATATPPATTADPAATGGSADPGTPSGERPWYRDLWEGLGG